jgi:hypothetical protein
MFGDANRSDHHVGLQLAAESTAEQVIVRCHFLDRKSCRLRCFRLHTRNDLRAGPDFTGIRLEMNRRVQRLHRRVCQERQFIRCFQPVTGGEALGDVANGFGDYAVLFTGGAQILPDVVRADAGVRALIPGHYKRIEPLLGRPHVIADHRDHVVQHDDLAHARNLLGGAVIDLADLAAEHRACR